MLKVMCVICIGLLTLPAFCQPTSEYQVATIISVKPHPVEGSGAVDVVSYDIAVKVADTIYVVLYDSPLGMSTVKYAAGRSLMVLVGKKTITYNDLLGRSLEVPIVSQKPATALAQGSK